MTELKTAIGLMSGTSMDGIDVALIESDGEGLVKRRAFQSFAYDDAFRARLKQGLEDAKGLNDRLARPGSLLDLERDLTRLHAEAVQSFLENHALTPSSIDSIGFHGQTVLHRPNEGLTVQIGDGPLLASLTGIDVVYDLRARDMDYGGQGAPLVPVYHAALLADLAAVAQTDFAAQAKPVCFVNIGGISNLTFIGADGGLDAFDSGPGNMLIDQWVEHFTGQAFDAGGDIGKKGRVIEALVQDYLSHEFFTRNQRQSLDRNDFNMPDVTRYSLEDGARTLAYVSAKAIFTSLRHVGEMPKTLIIAGGGRHNAVIMEDLAALAKEHGAKVYKADDFGFDGDAMEAEAWAYLAIRALKDLPLTFPGTTGVKEPVSGGVVALAPKNRFGKFA